MCCELSKVGWTKVSSLGESNVQYEEINNAVIIEVESIGLTPEIF
jgi:hypothetical protein